MGEFQGDSIVKMQKFLVLWENAQEIYGIRNLRKVIGALYKTKGEIGKTTIYKNKLRSRYWHEETSSR